MKNIFCPLTNLRSTVRAVQKETVEGIHFTEREVWNQMIKCVIRLVENKEKRKQNTFVQFLQF